jgi:diaminopimelate decarboxylase
LKKPFVTLEQLNEIVKTYPTPFHLYDEKGIRENARELISAFSWNKGFREYFAVKATPNPVILQILKEEGCGADCSSYTELQLASAVGFSGRDIMFSSNATPEEDYMLASSLGTIINLDDITDIDILKRLTGLPKTLCFRYNPGGNFTIQNDIMDNPGEAKYGITHKQIISAFETAVRAGVTEFGLHSFLVSNTTHDEYYPILARTLFKLAVELKYKTGAEISFINLSGGIGIPYKPDAKKADIKKIAEGVRREYEKILKPEGMDNIALYTELGRYMLGPYGCLVSRVIHEKHTYRDYLGLDACAANLMRPAMYGAYHHITVMGKEGEPARHTYDVTGGLCENNDKFAINRKLPKTGVGDLLFIHDTGAHGFAMGYNYNGKLRSSELLLREDGSVQMIRRAETPEDYFATFDFLHLFDKK